MCLSLTQGKRSSRFVKTDPAPSGCRGLGDLGSPAEASGTAPCPLHENSSWAITRTPVSWHHLPPRLPVSSGTVPWGRGAKLGPQMGKALKVVRPTCRRRQAGDR